MPGLNNFVSEMLMLAGLFDPRNLTSAGFGLAVAAAAGIFLTAWYTFTIIRKIFFGPVKEPATEVETKDLTAREGGTFGLLAMLCLLLGVYPQPLIDLIRPDANRVAHTVEAARDRLNPGQRSPADYRRETPAAKAHP